MRSHVEFRSHALLDGDVAEGTQHGEAIARYLATQLAEHGYKVESVAPEDWGWRIQLRNQAFPLWIGCGKYEEFPDGHLCLIEPSKSHVCRWLKRIPTSETTKLLATVIEQALLANKDISGIRWWTEAEASLGQS